MQDSRQLRREITPSEDRLLSIDEEGKEEGNSNCCIAHCYPILIFGILIEAQPDPKRELDSHQGEDYDRMEREWI